MSKVLGIAGSPRQGGISDAILDSALQGAASQGAVTRKISISTLKVGPCTDCGGCSQTGLCVTVDDMAMVKKELYSADVVVVSTPIYFGGMPAQLKAMIDRFQDAWISKYVLKVPVHSNVKRGAAICVAGRDEPEYMENVRGVLKALFITLGIEYKFELFLGGINDLDRQNARIAEARSKAFDMGEELVRGLDGK